MNRNATPYSQLKIFRHQDILNNLIEGKRCKPVYIRIKPTNKCNHNCSYCHYRNAYLDLDEYNPADEIPHDRMMEIISDMAEIGVRAVTFSGGGEPLLYPYIEEAMEKILDAGIDLSIITNGSMLKGRRAELLAKAKWVRISVESMDDATYCKIRGIREHSFDDLCANIESFAKMKQDNCELGINVVVGADNYHEIWRIAELMKGLGVNHVKFAPLITNDTWGYHASFKERVISDLHMMEEKLNDRNFKVIDLYTGDFADSVIFERQYHKCFRKDFSCVIAANSKVYLCQDKAYLSDSVVCDLSQESFKEGWQSERVTDMFREFDAVKMCRQHCVYDSRNELIGAFLDMDLNHVNFV